MNLKKELGGVADAVTKIMDEALKGNQHKIDANKNGKVDAHDFKLLRAKKEVKEETKQIDELSKATMGSYVNKSAKDAVDRTAQEVETGEIDKLADKRMKGIKLATKKLAKEETTQVEEGYYKDMDTNRKEDERLAAKKKKDTPPFTPDKPKAKIATPGKFGYGYSAARHLARQGMAGVTKEETEQVDEVIQKTSSGYIHHARPGVYGGSEKEKHVVDTLRGPKKSEIEAIEKEKKVKKFSEMLDLINTHGLKALSEMIKEEPDNEQFTQELKDQEAKAAGKGKKSEVAKGAVLAVKVEEEVEQIEERSLTEPEMKKKEEIVKSMKKGLSGFKARYGKDAKSVMYATATKRAMGEEAEQIDEASKKSDSHGVVILKKTHEVPSHVVHGEQGKNYTLHLHDVYHQKPGKKEKKLGQIESNIHNKDDENEAHIVSRHKDGEDFHMETHHAIEHLMNMHKIHLNTPIKTTKAANFKKGSTDNLPDYL